MPNPNPTIKEVAAKSGVGIGTVSRVLNNSKQISEETRRRVLKVIDELHYVPNSAGKRLSQNKSYVLAILVPVVNHPFFAQLIAEFELAADKRGYSLLVASSQHRIEKEYEILKRLAQNEADGALFVTHYEHNESDFRNLAIVSIDRHLGKNIPIVTTNNYDGTRQGVEYLIEKGCKKIAFIGTKPSEASEVILREKAYRDLMKEKGLEQIVINKNVKHGEESLLIDELFANYKGIDGIFVSGCILANNLKKRLDEKGIKVPEEVQVVSYDGEFFSTSNKKMTTLSQPIDLMAKRCVDLLIKLINNENNIEMMNKFDCRFIKGDTTK